jgi:hypothetical protein
VSLVDEHECLYTVFKQLIDIDKKGGFKVTILGKEVIARPWIHCIIGDIEGNNRLVAQYISNNGSLKRPNRHCKCENYLYAYADCDWVLWQEFIDAKERFQQLANNGQKTTGKEVMKSISRYEITTVWERGVPCYYFKIVSLIYYSTFTQMNRFVVDSIERPSCQDVRFLLVMRTRGFLYCSLFKYAAQKCCRQ